MRKLSVQKALRKANFHAKKGEIIEAERLYQAVLKDFPENRQARDGLTLLKKKYQENSSQPPPREVLNDLIDLYNQGKFDNAVDYAETLAKIYPDALEIWNILGAANKGLGKLREAIQAYQKALSLEPYYAAVHNNIGNAFEDAGRFEEAVKAYQNAILLKPDYANAHNGLAAALQNQGRIDGAIEAYKQALIFRPSFASAEAQMCHQQQHICDLAAWSNFPDPSSWLGTETGIASPWINLGWIDDARTQLALSKTYAKANFKCPPLPPSARPACRPERLTIGYFSADFHDFPGMYLMAGLLEHHNRVDFEIYAFSYGPPKNDKMRHRIHSLVDHFIDIRDFSDKEVVALVRDNGIDIAIHRNGYTKNHRTRLFQYRLSPIQINYLGYPGSLGADFIDYIIADPVVIPGDQRPYYSEKVIYLPHSYQPNDDKRKIAETGTSRADFSLPENAFVLCCFNNSYKISPREFDIWMRLLNRIEGSVLWLLKTNQWVEQNLSKEAEQRGITASRLVFADKLPHSEHLARHKHADLFIDTFNYNAHTTASDALWAGLPVVTKQGSQFAARVSASLLWAVGLPELIVNTEAEYEALILELARDGSALNAIKAKLAKNRLSEPLFDTKRYTRHFESGLRQAYDRYFDGEEPEDIWILKDHHVIE